MWEGLSLLHVLPPTGTSVFFDLFDVIGPRKRLVEMAAVHRAVYTGVLAILTVLSLSSGDYVRRGSNITDCSMRCPHKDGVLELYRECGHGKSHLLGLSCDTNHLYNQNESRLHLDTSRGCWTLTDAGKDDSCVYNVVYYGDGSTNLRTLPITVLDPVLISNITSNCSRLGEDIAVSVQFSGEETAVTWEVDGGLLPDRYRLIDDNRTLIIQSVQKDDAGRRFSVRITNPISEETREYQLEITGPGSSRLPFFPGVLAAVGIFLVLGIIFIVLSVKRSKTTKPKHVERPEMNNLTEEHGRLTGSSSETDHPEDGREESPHQESQNMNKLRREEEMTDAIPVPEPRNSSGH